MAHHDYKCWPEYFEAVKRGHKTFEIRKDDRKPKPVAGDTMSLWKFDPKKDTDASMFTREAIFFDITYALRDPKFVKKGFVILGMKHRGAMI